MKGAQLALPVLLLQEPRFENFFAGPNAQILETLRSVASAASLPAVWLYGGAGSGKSHLLAASTFAAGHDALCVYAKDISADQLTSFATQPFVALDDIDTPLSDEAFCLGLLRLIDLRRAANLPLILSASTTPARLQPSLLPDLCSRFRAMALLGLKPLRDQDRHDLLQLHAKARGLSLGDDASQWLLNHLQRDAGSLIEALEELDRAALSAKRRLSLPFIQQVIGAA